MQAAPLAPAHARVDLVDVARGIALAAMIAYHFTWDLSFYGFIPADTAVTGGWMVFARAIASSFLFLVGVSLTLAARGELRMRSFVRRLGLIAAAAAGVTAATYLAFPDAYVRFGILHAIALFSVLALPFLTLPWWPTAIVAVVVVALPFLAPRAIGSNWLIWIGLPADPPMMNDYVPLVPWFAATLLGIATTRFALRRGWDARLARARASGGWAWLKTMGRWSLVIYLLHQPAMLALLYPVAALVQPQARAFQAQCVPACVEQGYEAGACTAYCDCMAEEVAGFSGGDGELAPIAQSCAGRSGLSSFTSRIPRFQTPRFQAHRS